MGLGVGGKGMLGGGIGKKGWREISIGIQNKIFKKKVWANKCVCLFVCLKHHIRYIHLWKHKHILT